MNAAAVSFLVLNAIALLVLPRRWAPLPILVGALYIDRAHAIDIGPVTFTVLRLLVLVAVARVLIRGERFGGGLNALDALLALWGFWMVLSVAFHAEPAAQVAVRLRHVFDAWGLYGLFRVFCRSWEDVVHLARLLALVLVPIAVAMLVEKLTYFNVFSVFGGTGELARARNDVVRARGPFAHPILAGTIGAVCIPFVMGLWSSRYRTMVVGLAACTIIVFSSGSSGPIFSLVAGIGALALWRWRQHLRLMHVGAVVCYFLLDLVTNRPAYFVITSIDLTGGSTGWHRARLMQSAFHKLDEWWFAGTDYTRHWMASGVSWSGDHADITNHYLIQGVLGGLPLMLLFIAILIAAFSMLGSVIKTHRDQEAKFLAWCTGAALFCHAVTCLSVSYFDQSIVFLYLTLAAARVGMGSEMVPALARPPLPASAVLPRRAVTFRPALAARRTSRPVAPRRMNRPPLRPRQAHDS